MGGGGIESLSLTEEKIEKMLNSSFEKYFS